MRPKKITVLQHRLLHYRVSLFEKLREKCELQNFEFNLVHGKASEQEKMKKDEGYLPWARTVNNKFIRVVGRDILWQPFPKDLTDSDLVVVMQENKIFSNYPILLKGRFHRQKVAYWGHGVNFQSLSPNGLRERWKKLLLCKVDWWFAYTDITVQILIGNGFPSNRITCLNNAINTHQFRTELSATSIEEKRKIRHDCDLGESDQIAVFCGSLYPEKQIHFLIDAADIIHERISDFKLIFIGDGPQADELNELLKTRPWIKWVGVKKGSDKAAFYSLAKVILNPGAIGLNILDAFCAGLPLISTTTAMHGPEIAYLDNGVNGYLTDLDLDAYANAVIQVLIDQDQYLKVSKASYESGLKYSVEQMADNFINGINHCLARHNRELSC